MSDLGTGPPAPAAGAGPGQELLAGRRTELGPRGLAVNRTLPGRYRRMIGAWCFTDHFGPVDLSRSRGMRIPPHPHTGLQTVTWLLDGKVLHRDSLGSVQVIQPGELNLMTAGSGIAHSEESLAEESRMLHGVQLWVALPGVARGTIPRFEHHAHLPRLQDGGVGVTVLLGELAGLCSPATAFTPLVGAQFTLAPHATAHLPLDRRFEHGLLALEGSIEADGTVLGPGPLLYLGTGREGMTVRADEGATFLLLGGEPYEERLVMWWNFIGADHEDVVAARHDWMTGDRFGAVAGFVGAPLPAPTMPATRLRPWGRVR